MNIRLGSIVELSNGERGEFIELSFNEFLPVIKVNENKYYLLAEKDEVYTYNYDWEEIGKLTNLKVVKVVKY